VYPVGDEDQEVNRQRTSTVLDDVKENIGPWFEKGKQGLKAAWRGIDNYPNATKWISFGIALIAGISIGDKLKDGFFANFPRADNFLTRLILGAAVLGGAFLLANKGSDMLANKGAQNRADDAAAERQRREQAKQEWIAQGGNPNEISMSVDAHTNFNVFYQQWEKARLEGRQYVVPYSDGGPPPTRNLFSAAASPQYNARVDAQTQTETQTPAFRESQPGFAFPYPSGR
jgi:hypothetical protein